MTIKKIGAFFLLVTIFFYEFIKANLSVAYLVLSIGQLDIHPRLVSYSVSGLSHKEMLILAQMITLTPGTIVAKIDEKNETLLVHLLNSHEADKILSSIDKKMKQSLLRVTR